MVLSITMKFIEVSKVMKSALVSEQRKLEKFPYKANYIRAWSGVCVFQKWIFLNFVIGSSGTTS